ncbi:MAG: TolB family protein, partial [Pseudomonadota bacterium]
MTEFDRRTGLKGLCAAALSGAAASVLPAPALAQGLRGGQSQGNLRPIPIAIPTFLGPDPQLARDVAAVVAADLERSGLFKPLDENAFIERITQLNVAPRFADWRAVGSEALVVGDVVNSGGQIDARFRVWDTVLGKPLAGQQLSTSASNWRRIAHLIADQVYEKLTLEKGYFDTRVVFIDETGSKKRRLKRLAIMDQDGYNVRLLTRGQELVLTPRFSPTQQRVTYMSYSREGQPRVVLMDLNSGRRSVVGDFRNMTFAPRFSPDGGRIVMSLQDGGASNLTEMGLGD